MRVFLLFVMLLMLQPALAEPEMLVNGEPAPIISWDDLMPKGFEASLTELFNNPEFDELDDYSERGVALMNEMMQVLSSAPVVEEMHGRMVSIPGFVVPLEGAGGIVKHFFLVPYYGACIHVPPPPSNQIIDVHFEPGTHDENLYEAILVSGRLTTQTYSHEMGSSGYRLEAYSIQPYDFVLP
ncbi:MAG: DUF3299 domain-containing protein [Thiopseudomonas sp.]|nr:DUF3299 domain-containing protein [Thiopseudomonas sp.]MCK9465726.1 DUF3299 domain-containing protein [Thiopseudomonas sp.]